MECDFNTGLGMFENITELGLRNLNYKFQSPQGVEKCQGELARWLRCCLLVFSSDLQSCILISKQNGERRNLAQ